ncbi:MAG: 23S rRNA (adenine(2503)-C(2))-methyltransferase RlmN [Kiritimatiellae bacterium]|nr:23S rRNA (adenine(2503)-C(2))-methyltransferase RlmN [Kiritimatiellia bacterium]
MNPPESASSPVRPAALQGLFRGELEELVAGAGEKRFRAAQLFGWMHARHVACEGDAMPNVPKALVASLAAAGWTATPLALAAESPAAEGGTRKLLFRLVDGESVETVLLPGAEGKCTVCVSTQAGCRMGCAFCATGKSGFARSLSAGEIVSQVLAAAKVLGGRIDHVVLMGMGEPFDNYDASLRAVRLMNCPEGLGIGARKITISTCGIVPGIERLAGEGMQVELAVSLHAATPEKRATLMPVERRWGMDGLLAACEAYTAKTKRLVTFEYTLVAGLNDTAEDADTLAKKLSFPCKVNLIPLSPVEGFAGERPDDAACEKFLARLVRRGMKATLRRSRGRALDAACGQLRRRLRAARPAAAGSEK